MKKPLFVFLAVSLLLVACSPSVVSTPSVIFTPTVIARNEVTRQSSTETAPVLPTSTLVPTATVEPTQIPSPTPIPEAQQKIRAIMEAYGKVDEKYLTQAYWSKMASDIADYGPAKRIVTLEFHGDNYSMYGGAYSMTPDSFTEQMDYLMKNNFHFATGPETVGFIEGWLQLPARTVILTSDSSGKSIMESFPRILQLFKSLEAKYGYSPHFQSYIWTLGMDDDPKGFPKGYIWAKYAEYRDSGYFTFGSHTESHGDFSKFTLQQTKADLETNMQKISLNLGLHIYAITWPFEACSPYPQLLTDLGIKYAYGGWTRSLTQLFTYQNDNMPLCLPRLFPPNPDGGSGRPTGKTLQDLLSSAMDEFVPIP